MVQRWRGWRLIRKLNPCPSLSSLPRRKRIMVVLARPNYVNRDAEGNVIPPAGGTPADLVLPRAVRLPPQATHAVEVDADATHPSAQDNTARPAMVVKVFAL